MVVKVQTRHANMLQKARNEEITIGLKSTTVVNKTINYQIIICYFKYSWSFNNSSNRVFLLWCCYCYSNTTTSLSKVLVTGCWLLIGHVVSGLSVSLVASIFMFIDTSRLFFTVNKWNIVALLLLLGWLSNVEYHLCADWLNRYSLPCLLTINSQ